MTDTKPDLTSESGNATKPQSSSKPQGAAKTSASAAKRSSRSGWLYAVVILLLIIAALAGAVWYQYSVAQERDAVLRDQVAQSVRSSQAASSQSGQALSLAQAHASHMDQLQTSLTEAQQHLQSLEQALQMLTDSGTDIALINDVDQLVAIAHQQLLLGGNVGNAIIALDTAQARLARANRPGLASLQQAINGDLERLRAVSTVDINRLSSRIDELGRLIDAAPLLIPDDAAPAIAADATLVQPSPPSPAVQAADPQAPWWERSLVSATNWTKQAWWSVQQDLTDLVSVRRVDDASALLLSPEQAASLRDKLRLRLMTAQLALLMKQPDVWQTETQAVVKLLQQRYDINSVEGHRALRLALQLADTSIRVDLPTVVNSQNAIQALRDEHANSNQASSNAEVPATETGGTEAAEAAEATNDAAVSDTDAAPADDAGATQSDDTPLEEPAFNDATPNNEADSRIESASLLRTIQSEV